MTLTGHLRDEAEPAEIPLNLIHLSSEVIQMAKYTVIRILQLYADYDDSDNFEICHPGVGNSNTNF